MTTRQEQMELAAIQRVAQSISEAAIAINRLCDLLEKKEQADE